jgi:DNA-binding YbaB/EbfC family protein
MTQRKRMGSGFAKKKKEAKLMQQQFSQLQSQISSLEVEGSAGGGLVSIVLTGENDLKSIKIKPDCVDKDDIEGLELLIKTAYKDAQKKLKEKTPQMGLPGFF